MRMQNGLNHKKAPALLAAVCWRPMRWRWRWPGEVRIRREDSSRPLDVYLPQHTRLDWALHRALACSVDARQEAGEVEGRAACCQSHMCECGGLSYIAHADGDAICAPLLGLCQGEVLRRLAPGRPAGVPAVCLGARPPATRRSAHAEKLAHR